MRTVVETDEVAHLWAHQSQDEARNSRRNYSFIGELLYSYSTVIGRIVDRKGKGRAVLLTTSRYSSTTNRHQSFAARATSHLQQFHVPGGFDRYGAPLNKNTHKENLDSYQNRIDEAVGKAARARTNADHHRQTALNLKAEANAYLSYFGLRNKRFTLPDVMDGEAWKLIQVKQEKARKAETAKQAKLRAERYAKERAEYAEKLGRWTAGEDVTLSHLGRPDNLSRMRVKGSRVQTTQGAIVQVSEVRAQLPVVLSALRNFTGRVEYPDFRIGSYRGASVDRDLHNNLVLTIGCHRFALSEVERIAEIIGALPPENDEPAAPPQPTVDELIAADVAD